MRKNLSKYKGFTLIEIIVVLIILGVIASIAVPAYFSWINRARYQSEMLSELKTYQNSLLACIAVHPTDAWNGGGGQCVNGRVPVPVSNTFSFTHFIFDTTPPFTFSIVMRGIGNGYGFFDSVTYFYNWDGTTSQPCVDTGLFEGWC